MNLTHDTYCGFDDKYYFLFMKFYLKSSVNFSGYLLIKYKWTSDIEKLFEITGILTRIGEDIQM